jgi:hypothetical protein
LGTFFVDLMERWFAVGGHHGFYLGIAVLNFLDVFVSLCRNVGMD